MEAQYALQKKKPIVPLMLTHGYEADGWLGLLLGTSRWYALYGDALSSESAFGGRMDALCREVGTRGRADAVGAASATPSAAAEPSDLGTELAGLRLKELRARAKAENIAAELLEDAADADDPKHAVVQLLRQHLAAQQAAADADGSALRQQLSALRLKELRARAKRTDGVGAEALEGAADADDPKAAVVDLLVAAAAAAAAR
jgi:hypothetical protein